jgi:hypothetical protein
MKDELLRRRLAAAQGQGAHEEREAHFAARAARGDVGRSGWGKRPLTGRCRPRRILRPRSGPA